MYKYTLILLLILVISSCISNERESVTSFDVVGEWRICTEFSIHHVGSIIDTVFIHTACHDIAFNVDLKGLHDGYYKGNQWQETKFTYHLCSENNDDFIILSDKHVLGAEKLSCRYYTNKDRGILELYSSAINRGYFLRKSLIE